jgi:uncharacterized membrane protein YGL010W
LVTDRGTCPHGIRLIIALAGGAAVKTLEERMSFQLRYHRHPKNELAHFFDVPLIMFSLFVLLGLVRLQPGDVSITAASALAIAVLAHCFQVFVAPSFRMAEMFFAFGYERDAAERVERLALQAERGS